MTAVTTDATPAPEIRRADGEPLSELDAAAACFADPTAYADESRWFAAAALLRAEAPVHRLHLSEGDLTFDLTFENEVPTWMPGGGRTTYGDRDYFAWCVGAPRAKVSGTVRIGDVDESTRPVFDRFCD